MLRTRDWTRTDLRTQAWWILFPFTKKRTIAIKRAIILWTAEVLSYALLISGLGRLLIWKKKKIVGLMIVVCTHGRSLLYVFRINERFIPAFVFHYEQLTVVRRNTNEEGKRGLSHLRRMLEPEIRADFFYPRSQLWPLELCVSFFLLLPRTTFCKNLLFTFELQDANSIGHENEMWFFWWRRGTGADAGWGSSPVAECGDFFFLDGVSQVRSEKR